MRRSHAPDAPMPRLSGHALGYSADVPADELFDLHAEQTTNLPKHGDSRSPGYSVTGCGVSMRYRAIVGAMIGVLAAPAQAQTMPPPFEDMAQIVCVGQDMAIELLDVYEQETDRGEELLPTARREACASGRHSAANRWPTCTPARHA